MILSAEAAVKEQFVELRSGLLVPESVAEELRRPKCVDLFSGAGGFSLGVIQAGFEVVAACDNDPFCAMTYMHNLGAFPCKFWWVESSDEQKMEKALRKAMFGMAQHKNRIVESFISGGGWIKDQKPQPAGVGHFFLGDLCKLDGRRILDAIGIEVGELDLVIGSPPCGGFSYAGKRRVLDPRNSLVFQFARLVLEMRPKSLIMENVPGIMTMVTPAGIPVMDELCRVLEDGGFGLADSFKRAIAAQTGCIGLLRSSRDRKVTKQVKSQHRQSRASRS